MRSRRGWLMAPLLALMVLLPACRQETGLEPMEAEHIEEAAGSQAVQEMGGVRMTVDSEAWTGDPEVLKLTTPIRVSITNDGEHALWVRFADFALLGAYDRYAVLPVFGFQQVDGGVMLIEGYAPVELPEFSHEEFYVANYYADAYPGIATWEHALVLDDDYYARYTVSWDELPLPTEAMQRRALPEGVLPAGSSLEGFLFFEGLHPGEEKLNFLAQLEDVETGDYFGAILIPLDREEPLEP